jgi:hypothetical protein
MTATKAVKAEAITRARKWLAAETFDLDWVKNKDITDDRVVDTMKELYQGGWTRWFEKVAEFVKGG